VNRIPLRLGPLLFCACVALYRALWLSAQLSGLHAPEVAFLLLADLPVLGALYVLASTEAALGRKWARLPVLLAIGLVALYLADVLTVLALNSRLQLADIPRFAREWWLLPSLLHVRSVITLGAAVGCFFITLPVSVRVCRRGAVIGACLLVLPFARTQQVIPAHLQKYTGSVLVLAGQLWGFQRAPIPRYHTGDFEAYRGEFHAAFDAPIARSRSNIILVIVESLSAVDSYRTSGIGNLLPRFDELSHEGMLFRNFLANSEASEGGLVALLSGVPPLHFPTASTNTFAEYAQQRAITETFARSGYRCEFIASVPIDFISMDVYARSPVVGFSHAAGQKEIARFKGAPKFGFESPADHLLYEELLARLDARGHDSQQPILLAAVTASSHPPFVDPLGWANTEENVWAYVQQELWWLYRELTTRGFFEDGILLITGDHRKMLPVRREERARYGESAKARIPLVIIGKGIPRDLVDDRLFQQSDLLRMLDRVAQPHQELSPFALWAERYVFVLGVASNASNVQAFEPSDGALQGYRLNLRGAEIDWITPPADALAVEHSIHRQRASQQEEREAKVRQPLPSFGRDLEPSDRSHGMLIGFSRDMNLSRDPDDARDALKTFTVDVLDLDTIRRTVGVWDGPYTLTARGFLDVPREGPYWFSAFADRASCLAIDKQIVLGCKSGLNEGLALLTAGVHRLDLRFVQVGQKGALQLKWLPPGAREFADLPWQHVFLPRLEGGVP